MFGQRSEDMQTERTDPHHRSSPPTRRCLDSSPAGVRRIQSVGSEGARLSQHRSHTRAQLQWRDLCLHLHHQNQDPSESGRQKRENSDRLDVVGEKVRV
ncbi:hypothetical protein NHX12_023555 [Muraenolepis orangiensis]|uniref:Uncharacterized protein n=1 Tax=Muraenolepis orangiensis TaxID=630683 RepID=A0A9Q0ISV8_9TELE|nr:hypothetical protein NHX12_023555 [Muraenolepis orangiensis]